MKKSSNLSFGNIDREEISALTHIVDETLAVLPTEPKKFTTVDLWSIQRNYRTSFSKRYN